MERKRHLFRAISVILGLTIVTVLSCKTTNTTTVPNWRESQIVAIREAGARMGIPIRTERVVSVARERTLLITAPAVNLEDIPATALRQGADIAVAYVDSPGSRVPKGFYKLRAFADVRATGTIAGRIDFVDVAGKVVAEVPSTVEVQSLTLPPRDPNSFTEVALRSGAANCHATWVCYLCPNGHWICYCADFSPA